MTTQTMPTRTDLPPPVRHLLHHERPIGWLHENAFGFFGFADAREAANAAWVAYRTVSRKTARASGTRPTPIDLEPLAIERRDGREMITASGRPIAELVRPDNESPTASRWLAFAIEVAPALSERERADIMQTAGRALLKSGIRWSMVRPRQRHRRCASHWRAGPAAKPTRYVRASSNAAAPERRRFGGGGRHSDSQLSGATSPDSSSGAATAST